jgi:hypothetical protein
MFAVRYMGTQEEFDGSEHRLGCRMFDANGNSMGEQSATMKAKAALMIPGFLVELILPTAVVLEIREYGTYRVQFFIEDATLDVPIHFVDQLPERS